MYTKLYRGIVDGSLYGRKEALTVFFVMLALADQEGVVDVLPKKIADILGETEDFVNTGIQELSSPDPISRTPTAEGRRILLLNEHRNWGWRITNYEAYRKIRDEEARKEYQRQWDRTKRKRPTTIPTASDTYDQVRPETTHTEAEADTEATSTTSHFSNEKSTTSKKIKNSAPYEAIVSLYHEKLPKLPKCIKLTNQRKGYIRQRWLEDLPDMEAWGKYFDIVKQSKFLMGQANSTGGRPPFRADLPWLCRPENVVKVIEGKYHRG